MAYMVLGESLLGKYRTSSGVDLGTRRASPLVVFSYFEDLSPPAIPKRH